MHFSSLIEIQKYKSLPAIFKKKKRANQDSIGPWRVARHCIELYREYAERAVYARPRNFGLKGRPFQ